MYVTAVDVQHVALPHNLDGATHEIALVEMNYSPRWYNISSELGNNWYLADGEKHVIPDGYYNVCSLDDTFKRRGLSVELHAPTGYLRVSSTKVVELCDALRRTLGFSRFLKNGKAQTADMPHQLAVHREVFLHLNELATGENIVNGRTSTLLRAVPVGNESCGSGRTWSPVNLEYKKLIASGLTELSFVVLDTGGRTLNIDYIRLTLHVRDG